MPSQSADKERRRPARLAVAVEDGTLSLMALRDVRDERLQRASTSAKRLVRAGLRKEDDEVDGVAHVQGHPDLGVALEAADAGTVSGTRIENDHGRLRGIDAIVPAVVADLGDPEQRVVRWAFELAGVEQRLVLEVEQRRQAGPLVLEHVVGALAHRVEEEDRPLQDIALIRK